MYSVRQDLVLQSVFRDKERPTLIQFSFLKTRVFSAFPKLLFFFCVQFSNHAPDMSIERVSFPFLFGVSTRSYFGASSLFWFGVKSFFLWSFAICPVCRQMKHFPSFINFVRSSTLNESISMALGSFSLRKNLRFEGPAFPWPWVMLFLPIILIILLHWWSSLVAHSYQSSNFFGGDSRVRIRFCKGIDNVSRKRSIITGDDLSNFDSDTIILNLAICSSIESSLFIRNVFIFSRASPGES